MKILAIDYGEKQIGLAVSNARETIALPFGILENDDELLNNLEDIISKEEIEKIVIGIPSYNQKTKIYKDIQTFTARLANTFSIPVMPQDELLTTEAARRVTDKKQKNRHDLAAFHILESYLFGAC
ncbi:MAG: Holliday junction resolvase RuvX [Candidatus Jacksonbacteria bacterium]|nr:Holliday junction resolvase RuvX [Candidatus Jacksonbacteria bacterium]